MNGELTNDLENLAKEYSRKINDMSLKFKNGEYHHKRLRKMAEILATYMASLDELQLIQQRPSYQNKYSEYKNYIIKKHIGG